MGIYVKHATKFGKSVGGHIGGLAGKALGSPIGLPNTGTKLGTKYGAKLGGSIAKKLARATPVLGSLKKGGKIHKTGLYKLHKGELVLTAKQAKRFK